MSTYDLMAISQRPDFYLSSNASGDQSGKNIYNETNGSVNVGQPIIVGNPSSWRISSTETISLDANPIFFRKDTQLEFVIQKINTGDTACIFGDSDEFNGIFIVPNGIQVRFIDAALIQKSATITFDEWPEKMHVVLAFDDLYCTLRANNAFAQIDYVETDPDDITSVLFKTTVNNIYYVDGIGVYSDLFESKKDFVDGKDFDYINFISKTYQAVGTNFSGARGQEKVTVLNTDFFPDPIDVEKYVYTNTFTLSSDEDFSSISIESNYPTMAMQYKTNDIGWTSFIGKVSFDPGSDFFVLQVRVKSQDVVKPFIINIFPMFDDRITTNTPAELTPNGGPFYPDKYSLSIVNFPEGIELYEISYEGEWIEYIPNSVEILFMPKSSGKTILFYSSDGNVSCGTGGSVSGYTAYLNGTLVTDLDDARINQWNHLVITDASPAATLFYLNSNSSRTEESIVEYAFLAGYPSVLSSDVVSQQYSILSNYHKASASDNPSDIDEGELDSTSPFKLYTYAWAIIGGGGV